MRATPYFAALASAGAISAATVGGTFAWQAAADVDTTPPAAETEAGTTTTIEPEVVLIPGPPGKDGKDGADSTVPGPPGRDGADSIVPGPPGADSVVPGPPGADSTVPGPPGADSTVPGPAGADSVVPGPPGEDGTDGLACPSGFTEQLLTINTPGGQVTLFVCLQA